MKRPYTNEVIDENMKNIELLHYIESCRGKVFKPGGILVNKRRKSFIIDDVGKIYIAHHLYTEGGLKVKITDIVFAF